MSDKSLKDKAVDIKGKPYVPVAERLIYFNDTYKNGSIRTELLSEVSDTVICIKAFVTPNIEQPERVFTGYSQETVGDGFINKTSALENAETSAVGRALAMMGIGVIESVASSDEVVKAENNQKNTPLDKKYHTKTCKTCKKEFKTSYANAFDCFDCYKGKQQNAPVNNEDLNF